MNNLSDEQLKRAVRTEFANMLMANKTEIGITPELVAKRVAEKFDLEDSAPELMKHGLLLKLRAIARSVCRNPEEALSQEVAMLQRQAHARFSHAKALQEETDRLVADGTLKVGA